jgi:hypothetical protein
VRDAKGFVQIDVAHISADFCGTAKADLGVEIRAVHIDLSSMLMNSRANFLDRLLEHAVR